MKKHEKVMIDLLNASINQKKIKYSKESKVNWKKVFEQSKEHEISSLVYLAIDKSSFNFIDNNLLDEWKRDVFISNIQQLKLIDNICEFLKDMNMMNIEIIVLKGLVLRNYYPQPNLRSMGDADILIHKKDYEIVKDYLLNHEYKKDKWTSIHQSFINNNYEEIEVHWNLINKNFFKYNVEKFEKGLWENSKLFAINNVPCREMGNEDFLMHICLHMAVHSKSSGFGLRQLYDVGIFIKNKYDEIDWTVFKKSAVNFGIFKFCVYIFALVKEIFNVRIPQEFLDDGNITSFEKRIILNHILLSGVYGKKSECKDFGDLYRLNNDEKEISVIKKTVFPTTEELVLRYEYAKKHRCLLPIAWIHRCIRCLFVKYGPVKSIRIAIQSFRLGKLRTKIVRIFDL